MTKANFFLLLVVMSVLASCNNTDETLKNNSPAPLVESSNNVVLASEVEWTPLNAARGDQSPQAGTLWGNRNEKVATGFLVKFKEGFSSPPHIHNTTYRGVVIKGAIHNDDPEAEKMWMPTGSFWTEPAGEVHITAASAKENMAFIEIQQGPYLVQPTDQKFDNGERPVNVDESNLVWVDMCNAQTTDLQNPKISYLWGNPNGEELYGALLQLPSGFSGELHSDATTFRAVVIDGVPQYQSSKDSSILALNPGSYFSSEGQSIHRISSGEGVESLIYVRTDRIFDIVLTSK